MAARIGIALVVAWVIAHLLYLGPVRDATGTVLAWIAGVAAASAVIAALTVLGWGVLQGRTNPAWLRFVAHARTAATIIGAGLVVIGLLHYRDTEPRPELHWLVLGVAVLAGAGIVHAWMQHHRS
jgi:hypothetical protein